MRCPGQPRTATARNPGELQNAATRSWIDDRAALVDLELELVSRTYAEGVSHLLRHSNLTLASNASSGNIMSCMGNWHKDYITDARCHSSTRHA